MQWGLHSKFWGALALTSVLVTALPIGASDEIAGFVKFATLKTDIEQAIAEARLVDPEPPFFIIRQIDLKLQGAQIGKGGGEFSIPVWFFGLDLGAEVKFEQREALEVALIPPESAVTGGTDLVDISPLIRILKDAFAKNRKDGLLGARIKLTRKWALQRAAKGEVDTIVLKVGAGISDEKAQSITFHLCQTIDLKTCVAAVE